MIPLKDYNPRRSAPIMNIALIVANCLVFFYQLTLDGRTQKAFVMAYAAIPARIPEALHLHGVTLAGITAAITPLLTSMFLHGGLLHLVGNMWFLWVFGDNIEDRFGHLSYVVFYTVCGLCAGIAHAAVNWGSMLPAVGASGAISGVLGAYIVYYPRVPVKTLIPLFVIFFTVQLPAMVIIGYWFLLQFLSGLGSLGARVEGGTAWWAHIGGFLAGVIIALIAGRRE